MYDGKRPHGNLNFRFQTVCTQTCNGQSAKENFRKHYVDMSYFQKCGIYFLIYFFFACSSKCGGKLCYGTSYCLAGTLFLNYCEFDENPSTISSYFSVFVRFGYDHDQDKDRHIFEQLFSTKTNIFHQKNFHQHFSKFSFFISVQLRIRTVYFV